MTVHEAGALPVCAELARFDGSVSLEKNYCIERVTSFRDYLTSPDAVAAWC